MLLILMFSKAALGGESLSTGVLSLTVKEEYQDNVFFDQSEDEDFITSVIPEIQLNHQVDAVRLAMRARLAGLYFHKNDELNEINPSCGAGVNYNTERLNVGADYGFLRDSRKDRDLEETGIVISNRVRKRHTGSFSLGFTLSETASLGLNFGITDDAYEDDEGQDQTSQSFTVYYGRQITEKQTLQLHTGFSRDDYESQTVDGYILFVRGLRAITEKLKTTADIGIQYTKSRLDYEVPFFMDRERDSWNWTGKLDLSYGGEYGSGSVLLKKGIQATSGTGGSSDRTEAVAKIRYRILERLSSSLSTGYAINKTDSESFFTRDKDIRTFRAGWGLNYQIGKDLYFSVSYRYIRQKDETTDTSTKENTAYMQISYRYGHNL